MAVSVEGERCDRWGRLFQNPGTVSVSEGARGMALAAEGPVSYSSAVWKSQDLIAVSGLDPGVDVGMWNSRIFLPLITAPCSACRDRWQELASKN